MSGQFPWYVARSAGLVAWALLAASVLWGLALSTKILSPQVRPNWILDLHRWLGGLALTFTGVHVVSLLFDTYVQFGLVSVLVPFATGWHPGAVAWGVVSLYLLAAVEITSLLKARIPKQRRGRPSKQQQRWGRWVQERLTCYMVDAHIAESAVGR